MEDDDYRKYGNSRAAHFEIEDPHKCFCCGAFVPDDAIVCPKCGFPQNGDEVSQRRFLGELRVEKTQQALAAYRVGYAFHLLLYIPLTLFFMAFHSWDSVYPLKSEICGLFALAFILIWYFGRKSPLRAFIISLVLYSALTIPYFIQHPGILLTGRGTILGCVVAPYFFLFIGINNFKAWTAMGDDLKGKNTG